MKRNIAWILIATCCATAQAQVKLSPLFTDNMVMQQKADAPLWGTCEAGRTVSVTTSWDKHKYEAVAGNDGKWMVRVATPKAGGPYEITISDGTPVTLHNVMIGEVWLCSGQSNMDMPVNGWGQVNNYEAEVKAANHSNIRLLRVDNIMAMRPQDSFTAMKGGWQVCSPSTIAPFSAVAYFFGRDIEKYRDVPVGLIQSSWGGTPAEAWTSGESLTELPEFRGEVERIASMPENKDERAAKYKEELTRWFTSFNSNDPEYRDGRFSYFATSYDDSGWDDTPVPGYISNSKYDAFDGMIIYRKVIDIPESMAGQKLTLRLGKVDDDDMTYFNDIMVGSTTGPGEIREYVIPADAVKAGKAVITVRSIDTGGLAGITGYDGQECRLTAEDGTTISLNGTWKSKMSSPLSSLASKPRDPVNDAKNACVLYNAMINPLVGYAIKGAIWYQGEDNSNRAWQYRDLMPLMIEDWRQKWGYDFPFFMVQLANFMQRHDQPTESRWAELREAQQMTAETLSGCGLACIIDIGDANDIHPRNKQDVGHRLALQARQKVYGEKVEASGPVYRNYRVEKNHIRLFFDHTAKGLATSDGQQLKGFAIAGPDHRFHWADAVIDGNTVVVSSPEVRHPVAVRYAWADNPECNLTNSANLPAVPFRTDDWKGLTYGNTSY